MVVIGAECASRQRRRTLSFRPLTVLSRDAMSGGKKLTAWILEIAGV